MLILIEKKRRWLTLLDDTGKPVFSCRIALGFSPDGPKRLEGDGKTPEGDYFVCLKKQGKYGPSLGVSYPNMQDAQAACASAELLACIEERIRQRQRPPWGSPLGGEIYIHGGGIQGNWTAGCIALRDEDAGSLYALVPPGTAIRIIP